MILGSAVIMGLAIVGSTGLIIGATAMKLPSIAIHDPAAVPVAYLLPLLPAVILGQATRSDARQSEEAGFRQLRLERLAHIRRPQHLRHGAKMRHARRTEAALEDRGTARLVARHPIGDLFGLLVGP